MKKFKLRAKLEYFSKFILLLSLIISGEMGFALTTEVGLSYLRKKNTFDESNYVESESTTGTLSLYFLEKLALEFTYTKGLNVRGEKASASEPNRVTVQRTEVYGTDLIFMFLGGNSTVQPFIKGGIAQIKRRQQTKVDNFEKGEPIEPTPALVPSYGGGIKIKITESLSAKLSYDIWQTPVGENLKTDDSALSAGVSWVL